MPRWFSLLTVMSLGVGLGAFAVKAQRGSPGPRMAEAAAAFLATLTPEQRAKAAFPFEADERLNWHFIPRERQGLPLKAMNDAQRQAARALLRAGLSQTGYEKTSTIMSLEAILREIEQGRGPVRDPDLYYFSIFGEPSEKGTWGWRVEGHHLSLNFTVSKGEMIATTPQFLGANPAEVKEGPKQGLRALRLEEDVARELVKSLSEEQRAQAILSTTAPRDILTGAQRKVNPLEPAGLPVSKMTDAQRQLVQRLLEEYARVMPPPLARERLAKIRQAGLDKIHFAWAGSLERGQGHYYRLQGPTFLVEYDNTQNNANHIHSVWRDFDGDFGADLLKAHYETAPPGHGHTPVHAHEPGHPH